MYPYMSSVSTRQPHRHSEHVTAHLHRIEVIGVGGAELVGPLLQSCSIDLDENAIRISNVSLIRQCAPGICRDPSIARTVCLN